ncbi:MAG: ABC transporter permease subunit [Myxococcota bacterium]
MIPAVLEVARHELLVAFRTKRAVWIAAIYLISAVLGGIVVIMTLRLSEQKLTEELMRQGADATSAAGALAKLSEQAFQQLAAFFAGAESEQVAASLQTSIILPFFLWGSLAFLPFLILLTSFDQIAADLQSRSICYSVLRVRRMSILYGKLLAQTAIFVSVTAIGSLSLSLLAAVLLESFSIVDTAPGLLRIWVVLIPFGLCYLAISAFCSSLMRLPFASLMSAIGIVIGLRVAGWFRYIPEDHAFGFLRHLEWVSPATYQDGLWLEGFAGPASSSVAYLGFALVFLGAATWRLGGRDL